MKYTQNTVYHDNHHYATSLFYVAKKKFAEEDILDLQDIFLSIGIHTIEVDNLYEGRLLLHTFLEALRCYSSIGCLNTAGIPLEKGVVDMYKELQARGYLDKKNRFDFEHFLTYFQEFEFIWIELQRKTVLKWYPYFYQQLITLNFDKRMPIVVVIGKE
jgi:hypothetical protein